MPTLLHLQPGTIFANDFRVIRPLAEGGMGAVYVVEQRSTGHLRALKVMHPQLVSDPKQRERFAQEARVGSQIKSAHVVEVAAAGIDEPTQTPWIAMELLEGDDLATIMKRRGALPAREVSEIFEQLGDALARAHAVGIVHRDLKPENLFIAASRMKGVPFVAKVLDFGIARILAEHQTAATATGALGSPLWMAPEQTQRGAKIRPSTDVWALGLIAYYLLTGRSYWASANVPDGEFNLSALLVEIMVTGLDAASARAYDRASLLPPGFDAWFARCVDRNPDARFRDASEAIGALLPTLAGGAFHTPSFSTPTAAPSRPHPAATPPTAPWNATVPTESPYRPIPNAPPASPPRPSSSAPMLFALAGLLSVLAVGAGVLVFSTRRALSTRPPEGPTVAHTELVPNAPGDPLTVTPPVVPAPTPDPAPAPTSDNYSAQVAAVWRRNLGGVRSCYERALRSNPSLPSGRLDTRFTINAAGRVTAVSTSGFEAFPELGQCVAQRAQRMVFPAPSDGEATFSMPSSFTHEVREEPAAPVTAPSNLPDTPSRTDVMAAMRAQRDPVAACARPSGFNGTVTTSVTFASDGRVTSATASGATPDVNACVARAMRTAHVPPFARPAFTVNYPYALSTTPSNYRDMQW